MGKKDYLKYYLLESFNNKHHRLWHIRDTSNRCYVGIRPSTPRNRTAGVRFDTANLSSVAFLLGTMALQKH